MSKTLKKVVGKFDKDFAIFGLGRSSTKVFLDDFAHAIIKAHWKAIRPNKKNYIYTNKFGWQGEKKPLEVLNCYDQNNNDVNKIFDQIEAKHKKFLEEE